MERGVAASQLMIVDVGRGGRSSILPVAMFLKEELNIHFLLINCAMKCVHVLRV